jgi:hypothetical protein
MNFMEKGRSVLAASLPLALVSCGFQAAPSRSTGHRLSVSVFAMTTKARKRAR